MEGGKQEVKQVDTKGFVVGYVEGGLSFLLHTTTCYSCWLADAELPVVQYLCMPPTFIECELHVCTTIHCRYFLCILSSSLKI